MVSSGKYLVGGIHWLSPTPLKNDGVSWDDDIPKIYGKSFKIPWFQTTNQIWMCHGNTMEILHTNKHNGDTKPRIYTVSCNSILFSGQFWES